MRLRKILPRQEPGPGPPTGARPQGQSPRGCEGDSPAALDTWPSSLSPECHSHTGPTGAACHHLATATVGSTGCQESTSQPWGGEAQDAGPGQARDVQLRGWEPGRAGPSLSLALEPGQGLPGCPNWESSGRWVSLEMRWLFWEHLIRADWNWGTREVEGRHSVRAARMGGQGWWAWRVQQELAQTTGRTPTCQSQKEGSGGLWVWVFVPPPCCPSRALTPQPPP